MHNEGIVSARLQCGLKPANRLEILRQILITLIQGSWCFVRSRTGRLRMNISRQNVGLRVQKTAYSCNKAPAGYIRVSMVSYHLQVTCPLPTRPFSTCSFRSWYRPLKQVD